jgi:hypothetical protein
MRVRSLVVLLCLGGCRQSPSSEPALELAHPPGQQAPGAASDQDSRALESQLFQPARPLPPPEDALAERTWSVRSANGNAEVRQTATSHGKTYRCTIVSTLSQPSDVRSVMWNWETCIATRTQLKFVSPNGQRLLVLEPFLTSLEGDWRNQEVVALYEHGLRIKSAPAADFIREEQSLRRISQSLGWLKGQADLSGVAPRYTSDGAAVELETEDGQSFRLGFDGRGFPTSDLHRYEDGSGVVHFASSKEPVPPPGSASRPAEVALPEAPLPTAPLPVGAPPVPVTVHRIGLVEEEPGAR